MTEDGEVDMRACRIVAASLFWAIISCTPVQAQGLLYNLPEDGAWVRYEGTYNLTEIRPESAEGNLELDWLRQILIKSVGQEMAEYQGRQQMCRWIEFKIVTGTASEAGIDPGPAGARVYKVLVPESVVTGQFIDDDTIPISLLPIVRGFKRMGEGETKRIQAPALRIYPTLSLLNFYPDAELVSESEDPGVPLGPVDARHYKARSSNDARAGQAAAEVPPSGSRAAKSKSDGIRHGFRPARLASGPTYPDGSAPRSGTG